MDGEVDAQALRAGRVETSSGKSASSTVIRIPCCVAGLASEQRCPTNAKSQSIGSSQCNAFTRVPSHDSDAAFGCNEIAMPKAKQTNMRHTVRSKKTEKKLLAVLTPPPVQSHPSGERQQQELQRQTRHGPPIVATSSGARKAPDSEALAAWHRTGSPDAYHSSFLSHLHADSPKVIVASIRWPMCMVELDEKNEA